MRVVEDLGDVSEALRREFVQFAVAGIARSLQNTTGDYSRRTKELLSNSREGSEEELYSQVGGGGGGGAAPAAWLS